MSYNRQKELQEFDNTKLGVKSLVDSGITRVPRIFHHPPETLPTENQQFNHNNHDPSPIPVIDLSDHHPNVVEQIRKAATEFGFFQVINHSVPVSFLDQLVNAVKGFHELPSSEKCKYYGRDPIGVGFHSNYDLFSSKAASWRDTLEVRFGPVLVDSSSLPDVCREEVMKWEKDVNQLGEKLVGLLCEGLGLNDDRLKGMAYMGRRAMVGQYYPYCPEPNKTIGITSHTDPGLLTVLLQDKVGGLQVKHHNNWLNVNPIQGALVINIGDLFQMLSNDEYQSGEHRVVANSKQEPRISVAGFFSPGINDNWYGPLPELISAEKPAMYRQFKFGDFVESFLTIGLDVKSMTNYFRVTND